MSKTLKILPVRVFVRRKELNPDHDGPPLDGREVELTSEQRPKLIILYVVRRDKRYYRRGRQRRKERRQLQPYDIEL